MQPHDRVMNRARVQHVKTRALHGKLAANTRALEAFGYKWFLAIAQGSSTEQSNTETRRNSSGTEVTHLYPNVIEFDKAKTNTVEEG